MRAYRLARHLPESGIDAWVLTVQPEFAERPDPGFEPAGVPEERILRTRVDPTLGDRVLELWRKATAARPKSAVGIGAREPATSTQGRTRMGSVDALVP